MKEIRKGRIIVVSVILILSIISIVYGVKLEDIPEIISNGSILCLACIGIG